MLHRSDARHETTRPARSALRSRGLAAGPAAALMAVAAVALPAPGAGQPVPDGPSARALADSLDEGITRAALQGDGERLAELRRLAERARELHPGDPWLRHYHGYALYRIGLSKMGEGGPEAADPVLKRAQEVLEASAREDSIPESIALLSATLGIRIAADPAERSMTMGQESQAAMDAVMAAAPENPRVWLIRGINALYTPAQYGGGAEKARRHLEKALALLDEADPEPHAPSWGRAEAHAYLGQVHARLGAKEEARAAYRKALELAPGYAWVEHQLLPEVRGGVDGS